MTMNFRLFLPVLLIVILAGTAGAYECDYKWTQPPNMVNGFDVESWIFGATAYIVADDWPCNDATPISCIRWWGSYIGWASDTPLDVPPPDIPPVTGFILSWHNYEPPPPYSRPVVPSITEAFVTDYTVAWYGSVEDFWNPGFWEHEYVYEATLEYPWEQIPGSIYFLNIVAVYEEDPTSFYPWGWKNTDMHWNDDAVWSDDGGMTWFPLEWPVSHPLYPIEPSMDMAFEVGWVREATETPSPTPTMTMTATPTPTPTELPPIEWKDYNTPSIPGGYMPDFDQKQDAWHDLGGNWTYCGPVAEANSLWWFDQLYPAVVGSVTPGELIVDLAARMGTDPNAGTDIRNMYDGIQSYLTDNSLTETLEVHFIPIEASDASPLPNPVIPPEWANVVEEVTRCQDVVLLLGFWVVDTTTTAAGGWDIDWHRSGGHFVTTAGVSATEDYVIAISDPFYDAFLSGLIINGVTRGLNHAPPLGHNDGVSASHDIYGVTVVWHPSNLYGRSPGGWIELLGYPAGAGAAMNFENANDGLRFGSTFWPVTWGPPPGVGEIFTEVEGAVAVSPKEIDVRRWMQY